jgi:kynureninase
MAAGPDQFSTMGVLKSLDRAQQLDEADVLKSFRNEFLIPEHNRKPAIYFLGNSLGLQPKRTASYINTILKQWQQYGVEAFFLGSEPWLSYHDHLKKPLAAIVGALPHEVVVMNQLTVNLHLMLVSFYKPVGKRTKILCEAKAFPSDQYMLETHLRARGFDPEEHLIEVAPYEGEATIRHDAILEAIETYKEELALVLWGGVNYYTGQVFDMKAIAEAAHKAGAMAGFDLAHAAGNVPLDLHDWKVDFACWCSYKYLNSGPGAVGGVFIHERHHTNTDLDRYAGWWGYKQEQRFLMQKVFQPTATAEGWALSTPSPVLFAAHKAALELFEEAGIDRLFEKRRQLSAFLFVTLHEVLKKFATPPFQILTPSAAERHGSQVSILIQEKGRNVFEFLTGQGVFADWREPDVIRIAPVPLYNTFTEVAQFADLLEQGLRSSTF